MHTGDTLRNLHSGTHGTIVEMSDTHVTAEFPDTDWVSRCTYLIGSVTGKSGYMQYAELVECPHTPTTIELAADSDFDSAIAHNLGLMEGVLSNVYRLAKRSRYPESPAPAWKLMEGFREIMECIESGVSKVREIPGGDPDNARNYILGTTSAVRSGDHNES